MLQASDIEGLHSFRFAGVLILSSRLLPVIAASHIARKWSIKELSPRGDCPVRQDIYACTMGDMPILVSSAVSHQSHCCTSGIRPPSIQLADLLSLKRCLLCGTGRPHPVTDHRFGVVEDHINLTGTNPLIEKDYEREILRFPDMSALYDPGIREALVKIITEYTGRNPARGVLAGIPESEHLDDVQRTALQKVGQCFLSSGMLYEAILARNADLQVVGLCYLLREDERSLRNDTIGELGGLIERVCAKVFKK